MDLKEYFEKTKGVGVLSTSDKTGNVNAAVYARPHMTEDGEAAFIMADRFSYSNLKANPRACFLFQQEGPGYKGVRLYLKKIRETTNEKTILSMRRRCPVAYKEATGGKRHLVYFEVEKEVPLVGASLSEKSSCGTCGKTAGEHGHLCSPRKHKDKKCDWCGFVIADERHVCNDKLKDLSFICNSCGRTAVRQADLCSPKKIN